MASCRGQSMDTSPVIRMWITNKFDRTITSEMHGAMVDFLSAAVEQGCVGSTFAEDSERIIVFTRWMDELTLEAFRSSKAYKEREADIIHSFVAAGFEIPEDILFNATASVLFSNRSNPAEQS